MKGWKAFGKSEQRNLKDWNQLLNFLAAPEEGNFEELTAPTLILAGNCLPILADKAKTNVCKWSSRTFIFGRRCGSCD